MELNEKKHNKFRTTIYDIIYKYEQRTFMVIYSLPFNFMKRKL